MIATALEMRRGFVFSGLFHLAVVAALVVGLPHWIVPEDIPQPIPVELATIADLTTPPQQEIPNPEPEPEVAPPEETAETPPLTPEPPPAPEPPEPAESVALPEPEPIPEPEPAPEPEPEEQVEEPAPVLPLQKPEPPPETAEEPPDAPEEDALASLLKNVEELAETAPVPPAPSEEPPAQTETSPLDQPATMTEIAALQQVIKDQIRNCWNIPAGAANAESLAVEIDVVLNPDGSVARAEFVDTSRMNDPFYRAAADSAMRAVFICSPFRDLPADKYNIWQALTINFDPREML